MEQKTVVEFDVVPTNADMPLNLEVILDGQIVWAKRAVTEQCHIAIDIDDVQSADHTLCLLISGKQPHYTKIDAEQRIVSDSLLTVKNFVMDQIDITNYLPTLATYTHDFNGTANQTVEPIYENLGCNGTVEFKFSTPIYLWLLQHM